MTDSEIVAEEFWARKGDVDLFVFRKRLAGAAHHRALGVEPGVG